MAVIYLECNKEYVGDSINEKYDDYTLYDCILVRTTDAFPFNKVIETPIHGNAFVYGNSYIFGDVLLDMLKEKYVDINKNRDLFFEKMKKLQIASKSCRSTIHFSINGLVSSHAYGNFDNRAFTILEPLKYHIEDSSLLSLNVCDTYFNDDMKLSDDAIILIDKNKYEEIKDKEEYIEVLSSMKVYVYTGNLQEALSIVLHDLGYDSFIVNSNGYVNSYMDNTGANKMCNCIDKLKKDFNVETVNHFNSDYNRDDKMNTSIEGEKSDLDSFIYIFNRAIGDNLLDDELVSLVKKAIELDKENDISYLEEKNFRQLYFGLDYNKYGRSSLLKIISNVIRKIGLDKMEKYIGEYNKLFINQQKDNYHKHR